MIGYLAQALLVLLPWTLRRRLLSRIWNYDIDPTARIGISIVKPASLKMGPESRIGHLNFIRGMNSIQMSAESSIGNLNWIYGIPGVASAEREYRSTLELKHGAKMTHRHLVDCTETVSVGRFTVVAGYRSQILTHSVDIRESKQKAKPITFGDYSFVGTGCIVLGGSSLPDRSVLGAGSVLRSKFEDPLGIYSGVPATRTADLPEDSRFFTREKPYVEFG